MDYDIVPRYAWPMKRIALLVPAGANIASLETARQGFQAANARLRDCGRDPAFSVRLLAAELTMTLDDGRISVRVDATLASAGQVDICLVPPLMISDGAGLGQILAANAALIRWLAAHYKEGGELANLCLGAALPAAAGLLDGRRAVVHWAMRNQYAALFPNVSWVCDCVVLADKGLYTSGGALSAAHLVLHLIEKHAGRDIAIWCAKLFQLDWDRHSQLPFLVFAGQKAHGDAVVLAVQEHIETHYATRLAVDGLAVLHAVGRRTLERRFRHATGNSVVEYQQRVRVEAAKQQLERTRKSVSEVMYEVGYSDTKAFRDIFSKHCGMSPLNYRDRYG
ncbi:helix-turn-helix domain-containing protein [Bordetella holmesii]|nr:helix-turn-helix domain-containing protein [Bordetella holmesii]QGB15305.1 helix-turn-helix domain-containing protein [Bordetella holmesii]QGC43101.1 helix-turn-helix domain-containing protein [Bordetella holmesii]QJP53534.1 helix-turn-helix domain-containing protein [Bordetella holmesii]